MSVKVLTLAKTADNVLLARDEDDRYYFLMSRQLINGDADKYVEFPITLRDITEQLLEVEYKGK